MSDINTLNNQARKDFLIIPEIYSPDDICKIDKTGLH